MLLNTFYLPLIPSFTGSLSLSLLPVPSLCSSAGRWRGTEDTFLTVHLPACHAMPWPQLFADLSAKDAVLLVIQSWPLWGVRMRTEGFYTVAALSTHEFKSMDEYRRVCAPPYAKPPTPVSCLTFFVCMFNYNGLFFWRPRGPKCASAQKGYRTSLLTVITINCHAVQ